MTTRDLTRYDPVGRTAEPYMRARKNDVHIPLSFAWCQKLLDLYPQADRDICSLAILLHDIGWYSIDMETIIEQGFRRDNFLQSDARYLINRRIDRPSTRFQPAATQMPTRPSLPPRAFDSGKHTHG